MEREGHAVWVRRVSLLAVLAFLVLGLLNAFGQHAAVSSVTANGVTLTVDSPTALRGGLIFTTMVTVVPQAQIKDMHIVVSPDWLRGMTLNGVAPQASNDSSSAQGLDLDYQQLPAGQAFALWISWQVNPTNAGSRAEDITVNDGSTKLVTLHRSVFIFP